jgi:hypothetical protein
MVLSSGKYDPGCSSRIRILTFYPSRIPDPGVKRHWIPNPDQNFAYVERVRFGVFNKIYFLAVIFFQFLVIKTLDPDWIRIGVKRGKIGHLLTFKSKLKILRSIFCGFFRQKSLYELWGHCLQSLNH